MKKITLILCLFVWMAGNSQVSKEVHIEQSYVSKIITNEAYSERGTLPNVLAPGNDNCAGAIQITTLDGTCNGAYTLNGATSDLYAFGCQNNTKQVWFYFVAQGPNVEITVQGGTITKPEIVLFGGSNICTGAPTITYGGYCATLFPFNSSSISLTNQTCTNPLTVGQTYYFTVDSWGTKGTFCISVNNPTPNPPGTDCGTATTICSNTSLSGNASLWGNCELTTNTIGGCLGQWGEVNSSWYVVYVDPASPANATLTFTISPSNGIDDYDYSIWKGATCTIGAPNSCNFSSTVANTGLATGFASTSQGAGGTPWNAPLVTQPGDVYIVLINGYTPSSNTFNFNFGGTAILGCNPPPILPIELLSFKGEALSEKNKITWSTVTETNNSYFNIERSVDATTFEVVGKLQGAGNSVSIKNYSYLDLKPLPKTSYYRLKQVDNNGEYKYSTIISVTNENIAKIVVKTCNLLGEEVSESYKGLVLIYYSDGSIIKAVKQ